MNIVEKSMKQVVVVDKQGVAEQDVLNQPTGRDYYIIPARELPESLNEGDLLFYVKARGETVDLEALEHMKTAFKAKVYLVTEERQPEDTLPCLSYQLDGLLSLEFFRHNKEFVAETIQLNQPVLEPALHWRLAFEISEKKQLKTPIKQLDLDTDKTTNMFSENEQKVMQLLLKGGTNQVIANKLYFSPSTVSSIISRILRKMNVSDRTQAAVQAVRNGWVKSVR